MKRRLATLCLLAFALCLTAQPRQNSIKWYKFSKAFIAEHYHADSAIGTLQASEVFPASKVHSVDCGGNDGELHIGVAETAIKWSHPKNISFSAVATEDDSQFGIVAEPVNLTRTTTAAAAALSGKGATFTGYFRLWNEGHDSGAIHPSNPHHVLELHPIWAFDGSGQHFSSPTSIQSMAGFQGYGASKFKPLLEALNQKKWLQAYEDDDFVYVQLQQAENFYQLPVKIKDVRKVTGGVEATADVFSDEARQNLLLEDLRVVANGGSRIATRLSNHEDIKFLLGVFSVNLQKAMDAAKGHATEQSAIPIPSALEFFAYGIPLEHAVATSKCVNDKDPDE